MNQKATSDDTSVDSSPSDCYFCPTIANLNHIASFCRASISVILIAALFTPVMHHWGDSLFHLHGEAEHTHQHEDHCSEEAENNPCHRRLVHHDETADCAHDAHISTKNVECLLCSVAPLRSEGLVGKQIECVIYSMHCNDVLLEGQETFVSAFKKSNESRGPPRSSLI